MKVPTKILAEVISMVALSGVLHLIRIFQLPQGGSVTAAAMVPVLLVALRRGPLVGFIAGLAYGLVVLFEEPFVVHPAQLVLDYPLAFGLLGVAGFFRRMPLAGVAAALFGRFLSHFVSGVIFFATYAPEGMSPLVYSAIYNGSYIVPELLISSAIIFLLVKRGVLKVFL